MVDGSQKGTPSKVGSLSLVLCALTGVEAAKKSRRSLWREMTNRSTPQPGKNLPPLISGISVVPSVAVTIGSVNSAIRSNWSRITVGLVWNTIAHRSQTIRKAWVACRSVINWVDVRHIQSPECRVSRCLIGIIAVAVTAYITRPSNVYSGPLVGVADGDGKLSVR